MLKTVNLFWTKTAFWNADVLPTEMRLFYGNKQDFESPIFRRALLKHNAPPSWDKLRPPKPRQLSRPNFRWSDGQNPWSFLQTNTYLPKFVAEFSYFHWSIGQSQFAGPILAPGQAKLLGQNRTTLHFCLKNSKPAIGFPIFSMDDVFRWFWELILSNHSPSLSACAMGGGAPSLLVVKCFRGRWGYNQQNMGIDGNMIGSQQK